jgi:hypothetical protein
VHDITCDLRPLSIGEQPVLRSSADRAVPDRALETARAEDSVGLLEQASEAAKVTPTVWADRRLQLGRMAPVGNEVRIVVLLAPAWAEQVVDESPNALPARIADLGDHRSLLRTSSAATSSRAARRRLSAAYGRRSPEGWPVAFSFATA